MSSGHIQHTAVIDLKNRAVFADFYNQYYARLCFYAFKMVDEQSVAEDVVNEVFVRILQQKTVFEDEHHLKSYLYRSVRNAVLNQLRTLGNSRRTEDRFYQEQENWIESVQYDIIRTEMYAQIYEAIQRLPRQCGQVIRLGYLEGKSNPEIAEELGLSEQTVKNHKHRALGILKNLISKELLYLLMLYGTGPWVVK